MNDQYFAIEAWADGIYQDFEYEMPNEYQENKYEKT